MRWYSKGAYHPETRRVVEFVQRRGFQAARTGKGDERPYEGDGLCAALTRGPRADPVVHKHDGFVQDLTFYPGEHLLVRTATPVLCVRRPTDYRQRLYPGYLHGHRGYDASRGPPVSHGSSQCKEDLLNVGFYLLVRRVVVAGVPRAVKSHVVALVPHTGQKGRVAFRKRCHDEESGAGAGPGQGVEGQGYGDGGSLSGVHAPSCCLRLGGMPDQSPVRLWGGGAARYEVP